jgi:hypothetical protein
MRSLYGTCLQNSAKSSHFPLLNHFPVINRVSEKVTIDFGNHFCPRPRKRNEFWPFKKWRTFCQSLEHRQWYFIWSTIVLFLIHHRRFSDKSIIVDRIEHHRRFYEENHSLRENVSMTVLNFLHRHVECGNDDVLLVKIAREGNKDFGKCWEVPL